MSRIFLLSVGRLQAHMAFFDLVFEV